MAFKNRIRLALFLSKPQYIETRRVFTKSNGKIQLLSSQTKKVLELKTDYFPSNWHERLAIALAHDAINIENKNKLYSVLKDSEYEIAWIEALGYPVAQAQTKVSIADFEAVNSNCQSCDDICCAVAPDETIVPVVPIEENDVFNYTLTLFAEQSSCIGVGVEIVNINDVYVLSAVLAGNVITFTMKPSFFSDPNALLCQYKAAKDETCFDLGNVYAPVVGTEIGCPPPTILALATSTSNELTFTWNRGLPDTGNPDQWELYLNIVGGSPVQTGNAPAGNVNLIGLAIDTQYAFRVRSDCGEGVYSAWVEITESTEPVSAQCGLYDLLYRNFNPGAPASVNVTFLNCAGINQTILVFNFVGRPVCMQQTSPGVPTSIILPPYTTYEYRTLC